MSARGTGDDQILLDQSPGAQKLLLVARQLLHDGRHPAVQNSAGHVTTDYPTKCKNETCWVMKKSSEWPYEAMLTLLLMMN